MNRFTVIGRSGADSELKHLPTGTACLELSIADSKKHGEIWQTQWVRVVIYGERASKIAPLIKKGTEVVAIGELEIREVEKDGTRKTYTRLVANYIRACITADSQETQI